MRFFLIAESFFMFSSSIDPTGVLKIDNENAQNQQREA